MAATNKRLGRRYKPDLYLGHVRSAAAYRHSGLRGRCPPREFQPRGGGACDDAGGRELSDESLGGAAGRDAVRASRAWDDPDRSWSTDSAAGDRGIPDNEGSI